MCRVGQTKNRPHGGWTLPCDYATLFLQQFGEVQRHSDSWAETHIERDMPR